MKTIKACWVMLLYALLCTTAVAGNPLAGASISVTDAFVGTFTDGRLTLESAVQGGGYVGTISLGGSRYPMEAQRQGTRVQGQFADGGDRYDFTLDHRGDALVLETGGTVYRLKKAEGHQGVPAPAAAQSAGRNALPATQAGGSSAPAPVVAPLQGSGLGTGQQVLARGAYGTLTRDNAVAFIEALEFVLTQLGNPGALAGHSQEQLIAQVALTFPKGSAEEQQAIANARQIWTQTRSRWDLMPEEEKLAFARDVLALAWCEEAVAGSSGQAGGGGSGADASMYINPNYPGSDCWASAGCTDYDAASGTRTYEEYNYDTGGYDYYQQ